MKKPNTFLIYKGYLIEDHDMHYFPVPDNRIPKLQITNIDDDEKSTIYTDTIQEAKELIDEITEDQEP